MTAQEWRGKYPEARREYQKAVESNETALDWDAWRVTKGYIVDHKPMGSD